MAQYLDLDNWNRKQIYQFFKDYEQPFFNMCADMDVTALRARCREQGYSYFKAILHLSLKAANQTEGFQYRLRPDGVWTHDVIHAGSTVLNDDETFSFKYFNHMDQFQDFNQHATQILAGARDLDPAEDRDDLIYYSVIPWISFTAFSHARRFGTGDSVPKIVFGKYRQEGARVKMPLSVEVHHALMDGLHMGRYFEAFQTLLDNAGDL